MVEVISLLGERRLWQTSLPYTKVKQFVLGIILTNGFFRFAINK